MFAYRAGRTYRTWYIRHAYGACCELCRLSGGQVPALGRGRARIRQLVEAQSIGYGRLFTTDVPNASVALDVDSTLVALPGSAGGFDPVLYLHDEKANTYSDLKTILLPDCNDIPLPVPCHRLGVPVGLVLYFL